VRTEPLGAVANRIRPYCFIGVRHRSFDRLEYASLIVYLLLRFRRRRSFRHAWGGGGWSAAGRPRGCCCSQLSGSLLR